jgi:hypothetical protein
VAQRRRPLSRPPSPAGKPGAGKPGCRLGRLTRARARAHQGSEWEEIVARGAATFCATDSLPSGALSLGVPSPRRGSSLHATNGEGH